MTDLAGDGVSDGEPPAELAEAVDAWFAGRDEEDVPTIPVDDDEERAASAVLLKRNGPVVGVDSDGRHVHIDGGDGHRGVFVVGRPGTGKSVPASVRRRRPG